MVLKGQQRKKLKQPGGQNPHHSLQPESLEGWKEWMDAQAGAHSQEGNRDGNVERKERVSREVSCNHAEGTLEKGSL